MTFVQDLKKKLEHSPPVPAKQINYGTAGFRSSAENLEAAVYRSALIAVLRSYSHDGKAVGLCITASHNPVGDNGVKLVEPDGGMLAAAYEGFASQLVNAKASAFDALVQLCSEVISLDLPQHATSPFASCKVVIACDTRPSSPKLTDLARAALDAMGAQIVDMDMATTPMLHWAVTEVNRLKEKSASSFTRTGLQDAYFAHFSNQVTAFVKEAGLPKPAPGRLVCDAACGVGGVFMGRFAESLQTLGFDLEIRNSPDPSNALQLNDHCGAEWVQKSRTLPINFGVAHGDPTHMACCALDGDADRVVLFLTAEKDGDQVLLLDGDRLAVLAARTICGCLDKVLEDHPNPKGKLSFGAIQTAYANGASTAELESLAAKYKQNKNFSMCVDIAKTGVKNLHHKALDHDIAVYFESNGHGTVIFLADRLEAFAKENDLGKSKHWNALVAFLNLFNASTGDAMVDVLAMAAAMRFLGLNTKTAFESYSELRVVQDKVHMPREKLNLLRPEPNHEKWLVEPETIQTKINRCVAEAPGESHARAFVRPSGTEDACRIYVEAADDATASRLADHLRTILSEF